MFPNWQPSQINAEFTHQASVLAEIGDLLYWDPATTTFKPASSLADQGSAAVQQRLFASLFAGVSNSKQLASDATARGARPIIDGIYEFPCASATFAMGDYVAPTYDTNVLKDQELTKVTDRSLAIGKVVKRYASATTKVKVRLTSPLLNGLTFERGGYSWDAQPAPTAKTTTATLTIAELLTRLLTGTHSAGATQTYTLPTGTLMSGGAPHVPIDGAFDWELINLSAAAADTITVAAGTDHTVVGTMVIQSVHATTGALYGNVGRFRSRRTAATTWVTYRVG